MDDGLGSGHDRVETLIVSDATSNTSAAVDGRGHTVRVDVGEDGSKPMLSRNSPLMSQHCCHCRCDCATGRLPHNHR